MDLKEKNQQRSVIVIFAPGMGGNHLANMISVSGSFSQRFTRDAYDLTSTSPSRFHVDDDNNLTVEKIQPGVLACHLGEYLWNENIIKQRLPIRSYVIVEFPIWSRNNGWLKRITNYSDVYKDQYQVEELATLYSIQRFGQLTGETDFYPITVSELFRSDATLLIHNLLLQIDPDIDTDTITQLHEKWYQAII
jgi:hypothetical protein